MLLLDASCVYKRYFGVPALSDVSISAARGQVVGVFGPEGAGKSTLMKILAGLIPPDTGTVRVNGHEDRQVLHRNVAFLHDGAGVYSWMTVKSARRWHARFFPDFDATEFTRLTDVLGLDTRAKEKRMYPAEIQKLEFALAMARQSALALLDEPLRSLEAEDRSQFLKDVLARRRRESAAIVASPAVGGFEGLIDAAVFLACGRVVAAGSVRQLRQQHGMSLDGIFQKVCAP